MRAGAGAAPDGVAGVVAGLVAGVEEEAAGVAGRVEVVGLPVAGSDDGVAGALAPGTSVSRRDAVDTPLAGGGVGAARGRSVVILGCNELTEYQM